MSLLQRRRAEVAARTVQVQALRARTTAEARDFSGRMRALWPWLWVSGGALVGAAVERDLDRRPRARPGLSIAWLSALPWGVLIPLVERALAERSAAAETHTGSHPSEPSDR
jgi:hypothetical protein